MLEGVELFSSLRPEALNTLSIFCQERRVKTWEILFHKWDESSSMYIVTSGKLEVFDGEKILWVVKTWEFVGEMSIFTEPKLRSASVKALEDSNLVVLLAFSVEQLGKTHPEILTQIREVIEQRNKKNQSLT